MISHDMRAVYRYCTHVLELKDGKIVQYGPIDRSEETREPQPKTALRKNKAKGPVSATHALPKVDEQRKEGR